MVKFEEDIRREQLQILSLLFNVNEEIDGEYEAHKLIYDKLKEMKEDNNLDNFFNSVICKRQHKTKMETR